MIFDVLDEKLSSIQKIQNPVEVTYSYEDIMQLSNKTELRLLKLSEQFPDDYIATHNIFDCTKKILDGDTSKYRVLEFCMLKNRILREPILSTFPKMG